MTRKDYIKIAKIIKDSRLNDTQYLVKKILIDELCVMFKQDNSLFSRDKFIDACYDDNE